MAASRHVVLSQRFSHMALVHGEPQTHRSKQRVGPGVDGRDCNVAASTSCADAGVVTRPSKSAVPPMDRVIVVTW